MKQKFHILLNENHLLLELQETVTIHEDWTPSNPKEPSLDIVTILGHSTPKSSTTSRRMFFSTFHFVSSPKTTPRIIKSGDSKENHREYNSFDIQDIKLIINFNKIATAIINPGEG